MPRGVGYGAKHQGKGSSRQFGDSHGNGRARSGGAKTDANGSTPLQLTDRSNGRQRPTNGLGYE